MKILRLLKLLIIVFLLIQGVKFYLLNKINKLNIHLKVQSNEDNDIIIYIYYNNIFKIKGFINLKDFPLYNNLFDSLNLNINKIIYNKKSLDIYCVSKNYNNLIPSIKLNKQQYLLKNPVDHNPIVVKNNHNSSTVNHNKFNLLLE